LLRRLLLMMQLRLLLPLLLLLLPCCWCCCPPAAPEVLLLVAVAAAPSSGTGSPEPPAEPELALRAASAHLLAPSRRPPASPSSAPRVAAAAAARGSAAASCKQSAVSRARQQLKQSCGNTARAAAQINPARQYRQLCLYCLGHKQGANVQVLQAAQSSPRAGAGRRGPLAYMPAVCSAHTSTIQ